MINWLVSTSVTGSLVALFLILFKRLWIRRLGGSGYYLVCTMTLLLFVLPIRISIPYHFSNDIIHNVLLENESRDTIRQTEIESYKASPAPKPDHEHMLSFLSQSISIISLENWIKFIWACGFIFMLSRSLISYFRFKRQVIHQSPIDHADCLNVIKSHRVYSPMLIGFIKPAIVIPDQHIDEEDYKLAILHELNHYKQGDVWIKLLAVLINSLHWFNPITYLIVTNLNEACEYSCDEKLTKQMKMSEKKKYSEMILSFASRATPFLSNNLVKNKKQLYRRFELIMGSSSSERKLLGILMICAIVLASISATSLVFAETPKQLTENAGALKTYYNPSKTLEQNVRSTLGKQQSSEKVQVRVKEAPFFIDADGLKVDLFNRSESYYKITREWRSKNAGLKQKTLAIEGKTVTVAFSPEAASYKDDPVIERMVRNQISFELKFKSTKYDHTAFINELIKEGAIIIQSVTEAKNFQFEFRTNNNGDQLGEKPLTRYDKRDKIVNIFNQKVKLNRNIDGGQGKQIGKSFIVKNGETLAIDIKELTDKMPTINWTIINVTTGEAVEERSGAPGGYRYIFTPGKLNANNTFKIIMSGEDSDSAGVEIFTFKES
ncbi:M56 family metallopeptidase [Paenibacillus jiagnxiensis]|uniref:M56 family metallopeptidase n=1 Tax=Paenibacillus jiagnxiensis TaxID=3228926 RepID=UPI0033AE07C8